MSEYRWLLGLFFVLISTISHAANNEVVGKALDQIVNSEAADTGSSVANKGWENLKKFYQSRSNKPVWSRDKGPKGKAKALVGELRTSVAHGLSPRFYHYDEINKLMKSKSPQDLARLDLLLTGALVDFGHDLINGRITREVLPKLNAVEPIKIAPSDFVEGAAVAGNLRRYITGIVGNDRRYIRLLTKLTEFLRMSKSKHWPQIKMDSKLVKRNDHDKKIPAVRTILALMGDIPLDQMNKRSVLDAKLEKGIEKYQRRHGLAPSGMIDMETLVELSHPLARRIAQFKINLERRRWQNRPTSDQYVYFNIADGKLKLTVKDKSVGLIAIRNIDSLVDTPTQYSRITSFEFEKVGGVSRITLVFDDQGNGTSGPRRLELIGEVDEIVELFSSVVEKDDHARLMEIGSSGGKVVLQSPVELFATYLTAWATRDGLISFRPDIFNRDPIIAQHLGLAD